MIYLYTATPGTGKTCWVVKQLVDNWIDDPANENRKIYSNIAGLKIEGIHDLPNDFRECEDGSILIYDEPQDLDEYSSDSRASNPVAKALSKHRHRGFDIHFISQDPSLLHKYVLKNVYLHYYLWRPGQRPTIEIFTFARAILSPTRTDFKNAYDKIWWRFEKHYLQYFKSTVINTSKKESSNRKISVIITSIIFFSVIAYFIYPALDIKDKMMGKSQVLTHDEMETMPKSVKPIEFRSEDTNKTTKLETKVKAEVDYMELERNRVASIMISGDECIALNPYHHYLDLSIEECRNIMKRPLEGSYLIDSDSRKKSVNKFDMPMLSQSQLDDMTDQIKPPVY